MTAAASVHGRFDCTMYVPEMREIREAEMRAESAQILATLEPGYIYVIEFESGVVKVGKTSKPKARFSSHAHHASVHGGGISRSWVSYRIFSYSTAERDLIAFCSQVGECVAGREYFRIPFAVALLHAHLLATNSFADDGLNDLSVAWRQAADQMAPEGAVAFPGMEIYSYQPHRLLTDDDGNVTENQHAQVRFKAAEAKRAQQDAQAATARASREQQEAGHFAVWSEEQYVAGRDRSEITWDNCIRETGLWKDADAEPFEDVDDEATS